MAKTLLRSGNLDNFQSVGGGGQAVFDAALQIRETLRLRKQQALVECLAIPQINEAGDHVDWYSPLDGDVISWKAANRNQRQKALQALEQLEQSALKLARKCQQSEKTTQQLFGALLEQTLQFPGENYLFLLDGKPVITFWGFVNLNESRRESPFACLQHTPDNEPTILSMPEPDVSDAPSLTLSQPEEPLISPAPAMVTTPEIAEETPSAATPLNTEPAQSVVTTPKARRVPLWSLPVAAVLVAAVAAPLLWSRQSPSAEPVLAPTVKTEPAQQTQPLPQTQHTLPLVLASVSEPPKEIIPEEKPVVITAIPKDALVMDESQMRAGTTRFLNGNWRVRVDVKDPVSGKAPSLRYQIVNNKGNARLVHGDNIVCKAEVFSGLHQNGELMIKSRGHARCSDGSRYPMPEISCKAGPADVAQCTGRYDANTVVALSFHKLGA